MVVMRIWATWRSAATVQAFVHDFFAGRLTAHVRTAELGQPAGPPRPLLAAVPGDAEAAWASITAASFACAVLPGAACAAARRHWARPGNGGVQLVDGDAWRHDVLVREWTARVVGSLSHTTGISSKLA